MGQQEIRIMCNGYIAFTTDIRRTFANSKKKNTGQIIGGAIAQSAPMLSGPWLLVFVTIL